MWPNTARCGRNTTARGRSNRARAERTRNRKRRGAGSFPGPVRMLAKSTDWQSVEKARKQGNFASGKICRRRRLDLTIPKGSANPPKEAALASKGAYMDVSDRRMQVQLTQEAKIISDFYSIRAIFAFVGFVNGLAGREFSRPRFARCLSPAPPSSRRQCANAPPLSPATGTARRASRRCGKNKGVGRRRVCCVRRSAAARGKCGRRIARRGESAK